ncbi:MAG: peptidoglycan-binding protein, partial [Bauldia sp.]|nr:peptidoglycan-binding protein [Bauldia sp.]
QQSLAPVAFDPASAARIADCPDGAFAATPACWNFADFRRRVWGLGIREDAATGEVRLYYAVWSSQGFGNPDFAAAPDEEKQNSVWSVAIGEDGGFDTTTIRKEYTLPDFFLDPADIERAGRSNPVSDIEFPECVEDPVMLVAERGGVRNLGVAAENAFAFPHESRVLRYEPDDAGIWRPTGRYDIGFYDRKNDGAPFLRSNGAGGVDFGYGYQTDWTLDPAKPDQWVWMSGDSLCSALAPCFNPETGLREDGSEVHGIQGIPAAAFDEVSPAPAAGPYPPEGEPTPAIGPLQSWMVDTDENLDADGNVVMDELTRNDATRIGDVEIYEPCEGGGEEEGAGIEEPPVVEYPPDVITEYPPVEEPPPVVEGPDLEKVKDGPATCTEGGICSFTITITNLGPTDWDGPLTEVDTLPPGAILWDYGPQPEWTCNQVVGTDEVDCSHDWITLAPGQAVQLTIDVLLPFGVFGLVENCIEDTFLPSRDPNDPAVILAIERQLNAWGYPVGPIDGVLDIVTMNSIAILQGDNGLPVTGVPDDILVDLMFPEGTVDINPANDRDCHTVDVLPLPPPDPAQPVLADIQARKIQQTQCLPGGLCTFDLWFLNRGPSPWTGSPALSDELPAGATVEAASAPWICDQAGQTVACGHPFELTLQPNEFRAVTLTVRMPANLAPGMQNCATVVAPVGDPNPGND